MIRSEGTICAPATGTSGAIAIIRLSGDESIDICSTIFSPADKKQILSELKGYTICFGEIKDGGEIIDEVLVSVFRAPHSYTGENSAEISCHASSFIIRRILELLVKNGARTAKPGEFTQRAFLNGKLDLSQAEAVADLIASTTRSSHRIALNQMRGGFSSEIGKLRSELLNFASLIELELDFGEEDVEFADRNKLKSIIVTVKEITDRLSESFSLGNAVKNGIPVAIIGKPNSGKSTLLNALLMEERAIVSEIPGTTRDSIEDTVIIEGIEYRFIDTAGLRETSDIIENMGIQRTHEKISQATVVLFLDDISETAEAVSERIIVARQLIQGTDKHLLILINKTDTSSVLKQTDFSEKIILLANEELLFISAKEKTGLDLLRKRLTQVVLKSKFSNDDVIITNTRHYEALVNVSESLARVLSGLDINIPEDFIAIDIRQAIYFLGEITGEISSDEILGNIFKNFCIGK